MCVCHTQRLFGCSGGSGASRRCGAHWCTGFTGCCGSSPIFGGSSGACLIGRAGLWHKRTLLCGRLDRKTRRRRSEVNTQQCNMTSGCCHRFRQMFRVFTEKFRSKTHEAPPPLLVLFSSRFLLHNPEDAAEPDSRCCSLESLHGDYRRRSIITVIVFINYYY